MQDIFFKTVCEANSRKPHLIYIDFWTLLNCLEEIISHKYYFAESRRGVNVEECAKITKLIGRVTKRLIYLL